MHREFGITQNRTHGKTWAVGYGVKRKASPLYVMGVYRGYAIDHYPAWDARVFLGNVRQMASGKRSWRQFTNG